MSCRSEKVDRLSCVDEDVLSNILSLMPIKYAVRTSMLSKSWRCRWMSVTNLNFDDIQPMHGLECLTECVDQVLKFCTTSQLKLFRLPFLTFGLPKSSISRWISEAVRLNVRELDVHTRQVELPPSLFTCKTLTTLRLCNVEKFWNFSSHVNLPCLKTLDISIYNDSSVKLFKLVQGWPLIESLDLGTTLHSNEKEYNFNIPTLKRMKLFIAEIKPVGTKVILNIPNLQYLDVRGIWSPPFVIEDLSSLVEATVLFVHVSYDYLLVELLIGISGAKSLSWSCPTIVQCMEFPIFSNLKRLELTNHYHSSVLVYKFLQSASKLEYLKLKYSSTKKLMQVDSCLIEPPPVPTCMLTNLKTLYLSQNHSFVAFLENLLCHEKVLKTRKYDGRFLKYMLGNAKVLKTLTIENLRLPRKDELLKFTIENLRLPLEAEL